MNVAVTVFAASIVTTQLPVPVQAPDHPVNVEVASGVAVRVTEVPEPNVAEQSAPQVIPAGAEVTVPRPVPCRVTVSV
ncbi:MAG: hypothetical protein EPO65_04830 [Dehalococcoidia bacterium]|nr:MAG: hypothetical protein EPO65_04830 [Dehalococcoidia bacterium]